LQHTGTCPVIRSHKEFGMKKKGKKDDKGGKKGK